jgi:hypothetical protein
LYPLLIIKQKLFSDKTFSKNAINTDAISALSDQLSQVVKEIEILKQPRT